VFEASSAERLTVSEDRRMWRLLLARLHPDAGGDHDLFTFACAIRDEVSGGDRVVRDTEKEDNDQRNVETAGSFLRAWQDAMGNWSSSNRDVLKDIWTH
jgi:hypothetical protein